MHKIEFNFDNDKSVGLLKIEGILTVQHASVMKYEFSKALHNVNIVEIDIHNVKEFDLSFLQLLCAVCKTCIKTNKKLKIVGTQNELLIRICKDAGYYRNENCKKTDDYSQCPLLSGGFYD